MVRWNAGEYGVVRCDARDAMQYNVLFCHDAVECGGMRCNTMRCNAMCDVMQGEL